MSEIVPVAERVKTVSSYFNAAGFQSQIQAALPRTGITPERMARLALTEVRRNPTLSECRIESLLGAVMQCAQYGLEPGPAGHAWIIPRKNKGVLEANFQLGYKGLCQLLYRSGNISWINCQCVREGDSFDYSLGAPPSIQFRPSDDEEARGDVTHVFAAIGTTTGGTLAEVWSKARVEKHRERFCRYGDVWDENWEPMAKKTVLIQVAKFAPLSIEAHAAIELDDRDRIGKPQEIDITPPKIEDDPEAPEGGDAERAGEALTCPECGYDQPEHSSGCPNAAAEEF